MDCADELMKEHDKWPCCMSVLENIEEAFALENFPITAGPNKTHSLLHTFRKNRFKGGCSGWYAQGMGCFVFNLTVPLYIMVVDVGKVLKRGMSLPDLGKFLESPKGIIMMEEECPIMKLEPKQLAWLPFGVVAIPVVRGIHSEKKDEYGHCVVTPIFDVQRTHGLDKNVKNSLLEAIAHYLAVHSPRKAMWRPLKAAFDAFKIEVDNLANAGTGAAADAA